MATLYDLANDYTTVIEGGFVVDTDTGEVFFDPSDIDELKYLLKDKIENVACYVKNELADAEALRAEELALAARRRLKERKAERLKEYMKACMESAGIKKVDMPRAVVSVRTSKRVEVTDESALKRCAPMCFKPQPDKLDKALLKKIMKEGGAVDGAELVESPYVILK